MAQATQLWEPNPKQLDTMKTDFYQLWRGMTGLRRLVRQVVTKVKAVSQAVLNTEMIRN